MDATELEQALAEIEEKLEKLRVLYDQYFMGLERFEPVRKREDLERRIKVLRRENIRNTAQRFRFQQSVQRLNTFAQYWTRILREIEKGTYKRDLAKAARRFGDASLGKKKLTTADIERAALTGAGPSDEPEELDSSWLEADEEDELDEDTSPFRRAEMEAAIAAAAPKVVPGAVPKGPLGATPAVAPAAVRAPGVVAPAAAPAPAAAASVPAPARRPAAAKLDLDDDDELFAGLDTSGASRPVAPAAAKPASSPVARPAVPPSSPSASAPGSTPSVPAPRPPMPSVGGVPRPPMPSVPGGLPRPPMPSVPAPAGGLPRPPQPSAPGSVPRPPQPSMPQVASSAVVPGSPGSSPGPERGPRPEPRPAAARPEPRPSASRDDGLQDARIRDIYDRYVEARRRTNEPTGSLTLDGLSKSLRDSIPKLQQKHGGRVVDFEVVIKDGKTVLKPVVKST